VLRRLTYIGEREHEARPANDGEPGPYLGAAIDVPRNDQGIGHGNFPEAAGAEMSVERGRAGDRTDRIGNH
jgi:hypothetical protein